MNTSLEELAVLCKNHILINVNFIPSTGNFIVALMDITESRKTLEELDKQREELSDFAHYMSHDIRNSLSAIEGYIDVFKVDKDENYIDKIAQNRLDIEDKIRRKQKQNVKIVRPRGYIIAGTRAQLNDDEDMSENFRILNDSLKNIDLIFYDDLLLNIKAMLSRFTDKYSVQS